MKSKASTPKSISLKASLIPVVLLVVLLAYNVFVFGDDALSGSNQFILLIGGAIAAVVGFYHKVSYEKMLAVVDRIIKKSNHKFKFVDLGGGMGISYEKHNKKLHDKTARSTARQRRFGT